MFNQRTNILQSFFCFSTILFHEDKKNLKNIMYLKTNNYAMNEIIKIKTLSQKTKRSLSSSSRQHSVSVVQIANSQINNVFNMLKDWSNFEIKFESTLTQTTCDAQFQFIFKFKDRFFNNKKTLKSSQNEKL
jgi:hypothetical protein